MHCAIETGPDRGPVRPLPLHCETARIDRPSQAHLGRFLLQAVDYCVEIPQFGVVRSLNVHVSGSVLVWEYARQQMRMKSK